MNDLMLRRAVGLVVVGVVTSGVAASRASAQSRDESASEHESDGGEAHFEATMGFIAGRRSYEGMAFATESSVPGAGALVAPFEAAPFDGATVLGLRYDLRLVASHVRMTAGVDLPFATYRASDATGTYRVLDQDSRVTVQSLRPYELRFGIGGEGRVGPVALFGDLMGGVHWIDAALSIEGQTADYSAVAFAFSVRAGARLYVRDWFFISTAAELGLIGPITLTTELSLGFDLH